jgi:hypothetical protein
MKKFIISEEEKSRILNLHNSLKESILSPTKSVLNENVGVPILGLLRGFKTLIKQSGPLMSKLDDMARTFRNAGKYPGKVTSGDDLLELFLSGKLSNTSATDDMATVLLSIFKTADDIQLIRALAKEMVDGDAIFRQGVLNGTINPIVAFGQKQGDEILDYAYRAYGRTNPFSPGGVYNPNVPFGNWNSNIIPGLGQLPQIPQDYVIKKLRASFAGNSKAMKYLEKAKDDINSFIPTNQIDAEEIVRKNEALIDAYLAKKGLGEEFKEMFKKTLVNNWATKGAIIFFILLAVSFVFMVIMKLTGFTGLTPLRNVAIGLGIQEEYEAAKDAICKSGLPWACKSSEGEEDAPPSGFGDMN